ncbi:MAG: Tat pathway signal protein [Kiritimatiellia bacterium]
MMTRRDFMVAAAGAATAGMRAQEPARPGEIRSVLLHLGRNMWGWTPPADMTVAAAGFKPLATELECREDLWRAATDRAAARGLNMVVIDIGEALAYPSHPELGVKGAWSPDRMRAEVARLKAMGLEAIPKLNFSTTHNGWLGDYRFMLATRTYYQVCEDLIRDVAEIFGTPRFFHIGFDEETTRHQEQSPRNLAVVVRKGELWWHDFLHIVRTCEKNGMRPWNWADYGWHHAEYFTKCPTSVLQGSWYYDEADGDFSLDDKVNSDAFRLRELITLEKHGFDQVPCGTNWVGWKRKRNQKNADDVIGKLIAFGRAHISPARLKGFMMAPWAMCDTAENNERNLRGIDLFAEGLAAN